MLSAKMFTTSETTSGMPMPAAMVSTHAPARVKNRVERESGSESTAVVSWRTSRNENARTPHAAPNTALASTTTRLSSSAQKRNFSWLCVYSTLNTDMSGMAAVDTGIATANTNIAPTSSG